MVAAHVSEYKSIIDDLRKEIEQLREQITDKGRVKTAKEAIELGSIPRPVINANSKTCTNCGYNMDTKINTFEELNVLKEHIFENYRDRVNIRKEIQELHETNLHNTLDMKYNLANLLMWKKQDILIMENMGPNEEKSDMGDRSPMNGYKTKTAFTDIPKDIAEHFMNAKTLKKNMHKNTVKREQLRKDLETNFKKASKIKKNI